jgi:hypothetical protein
VTVACGHLAFARYPVLVGHYRGDTFAGTEAMLDRVLAKRLTERRSMSLYPGPIATSTVVFDSSARPPGAVVVGLGEAADLAAGPLRRTLRHGVLAFAAARLDLTRSKKEITEEDSLLRLSTLLIGAGEGGLDRQKCVQALLQAVNQAHAILTKLELKPRLDQLEIVELYEDRAYATWRAIKAALKTDRTLDSSFKLNDKLRRPVGSRRSGPVGRDPTWWQPIQITMSDDSNGDPNLCFTIGGGLARAEARTIAANLELVAPLVRRTSRTTVDDSTRNSPGRVAEGPERGRAPPPAHAGRAERRLSVGATRRPASVALGCGGREEAPGGAGRPCPPAAADPVSRRHRSATRQAKGARHRRSKRRADGRLQPA